MCRVFINKYFITCRVFNLCMCVYSYNCDGDVVFWLRRSHSSAVRKLLVKTPCPLLSECFIDCELCFPFNQEFLI